MNNTPVEKSALFHYAFIALPLSFAGLPLYIHMPDFYTAEFGMSIGMLGVVLLALRIFDALQDPVIGYLSDRMAKQRRGIILIGIMALAAGIGGLSFGPPPWSPVILWFSVFMIFATLGFSILTININMMGGFWHDTNAQRARISSWREGFGLVGLLLAAILPAALQSSMSVQASFIVLFTVFAAFMAAAAAFFYRFMVRFSQDRAEDDAQQNNVSPFALLSILSGPQRGFFVMSFLSYVSASMPAVLVLFFIRDYLGAEAYSGAFLALYFIAGAGFIGLWGKASKHFGLYHSWAYAMILSVLTFIGAIFLSPGDVWAYGVICVLSGIALGADLALPPAIIAGRISDAKHTQHASQYYAVLALLPKVAMALAAGGAFIALDMAGFEAKSDNSDQALTMLLMTYALVPCLLKSLSAFLLWRLIQQEGHHHEHTERSSDNGTTHIS